MEEVIEWVCMTWLRIFGSKKTKENIYAAKKLNMPIDGRIFTVVNEVLDTTLEQLCTKKQITAFTHDRNSGNIKVTFNGNIILTTIKSSGRFLSYGKIFRNDKQIYEWNSNNDDGNISPRNHYLFIKTCNNFVINNIVDNKNFSLKNFVKIENDTEVLLNILNEIDDVKIELQKKLIQEL
jgi:hypothetical protein